MNYYSIQHSLDNKIMYCYPQIKEVIYHSDVDNDPSFIGNYFFEEINIKPTIANPILHSKSNLTDLIYIWHVGFAHIKLISGKLKSILENNRNSGLQFFQCSIFKDGIEYQDYWILNVFQANMEYVDIDKSVVLHRQRRPDGGTFTQQVEFKSIKDFQDIIISEGLEGKLYLDKIVIKDSGVTDNFFSLKYVSGGVKHIVSKMLRDEIIDAGCTGIEFQPTELSSNEWIKGGGEREKEYGID